MNVANEKIIDAPTLAGFFGGLLIGGAAGAGAMLAGATIRQEDSTSNPAERQGFARANERLDRR